MKRKVRCTIDPGTDFTGVAFWASDAEQWPRAVPPIQTELLRPLGLEGAPFEDRAGKQTEHLEVLLAHYECDAWEIEEVACELPEVFDDQGSMAAAKKGSLIKLAFCAGGFNAAAALRGIPFRPIPVRDWKGQLSKPQVNRRIERVLGHEACVEFRRDVWDAVGIGLWLKGLL